MIDASVVTQTSKTSSQKRGIRSLTFQWNDALSKKHYANSKLRIEKLKADLEAAMSDSVGDNTLLSTLNLELLKEYKEEEYFWRQRSRLMLLAAGDRKSGYFHAVCKGKKARNRIIVLENAAGLALYEESHIVQEITSYFQTIFTSSDTPNTLFEPASLVEQAISPCISAETNECLIRIPSPEEVRIAMFSIHPDKAPGPDGFPPCFFQSNWSTVGPIITKEMQDFFRTGSLPAHINETHVRLIPKVQSPNGFRI